MTPPPILSSGESDRNDVKLLNSSSSLDIDAMCANGLGWTGQNYMGLSGSPCLGNSDGSVGRTANLNLKATELRLGLPGSQSPDRSQLEEKPFFPLHPSCAIPQLPTTKPVVPSNKRGFCDAMEEGTFRGNSEGNTKVCTVLENKGNQLAKPMDVKPPKSHNISATSGSVRATKAQAVGWPPLPQFRKNSLAKVSDETDASGSVTLFVKVSMDGAPYQRKVDLKQYSSYESLSTALERMFSCFTIGQYGSEYVLAYEDEVGDLMRVGDVPWGIFIEICKRLKITKSSCANELAPRVVEKSMFKT